MNGKWCDMEKHSVFGPSSSAKWLNCPGSIKAEKGIPDTTSEFAEEGLRAHSFAEQMLQGNQVDCQNKEMLEFVETYVSYINGLGGVQEYEQKVSYDNWVPGGFGTADAIVVKGNSITIADLKYGKGVPVFAEENPQGMLYALGALSERDAFQVFEKVIIVIHQPRLNSVSEWETTPEHIYEFAAKARQAYEATLKDDAPRIPGEKQCQWCRAKATCPALAEQTEKSLLVHFDDLVTKTPPAPGNLTDQQLKVILDNKTMIEKWLKSVEQHVVGRFESGSNFPGFKMVEGRSNRKWADDAKAEKLLIKLLGKDNAYKKKLLTAPAAEKLLGKEKKAEIKDLIIKPEGKPVLVPENDKRPPITLGVTAANFD